MIRGIAYRRHKMQVWKKRVKFYYTNPRLLRYFSGHSVVAIGKIYQCRTPHTSKGYPTAQFYRQQTLQYLVLRDQLEELDVTFSQKNSNHWVCR